MIVLNILKILKLITMILFSRITADHWTAKNKLEEAAKQLAYSMDRKLIKQEEVKSFMNEFQKKVDELCAYHKRCKPLRFSWHACYDEKYSDIWIYCDGVFNMSLFEAKS
jgi:hypothetical protein